MGVLCRLGCFSEPVTDAAQVAPNYAPTLRICFAVRTKGIKGTQWECREYQIRFRDSFFWRRALDYHPDTSVVPDTSSSGQEDGFNNVITELNMTTAEFNGENTVEAELDGENTVEAEFDGENTVEAEFDGETGDGRAFNLKSHWSLSTTYSTFSLDTARASGKSHFRKETSTKTSLPSAPVQTTRLDSKQTDSLKQSQQPPTFSQSQERAMSDNHTRNAEEEKRPFHKDTLEQLEGKLDRKPREKHDSIPHNLRLLFEPKYGQGNSQPQLMAPKYGQGNSQPQLMAPKYAQGNSQPQLMAPKYAQGNSQPQPMAPKYQGWAGLRMLIASGLDAKARGHLPMLTKEQEAVLLPVKQKENSFKVSMRHPEKATVIDDVKAAMKQIEAQKWKDVVIFIRDGDAPQEQRKWRTREEPRVLDWVSSAS